MAIYSYDIEADGLLDEVSKIHCMCIKELYNPEVKTLYQKDIFRFINSTMEPGSTMICHNQLGYDLPVLKKLLGIGYYVGPDSILGKSVEFIDTYALSVCLNPDRLLPRGCPKSILNPNTGKKDLIGPHGLMAWSYRVDGKKPVIHDWKDQPIEVYVDRCIEDVLVTEKVFLELMKEGEVDL